MAPADLLLVGKVLTMDELQPVAHGVVVRRGIIEYVGSEEGAKRRAFPSCQVIEVERGCILPGFIDAHTHLLDALMMETLDLRRVEGVSELLSRIKEKVRGLARGRWVLGTGWSEGELKEGRAPTKEELDRIAPHNPVLLLRKCGHLAVANSKALASLPPRRERRGLLNRSSGIVKEELVEELLARVPLPSGEEAEGRILEAYKMALKHGITCLHAMLLPYTYSSCMEAIQALRVKRSLPLRLRLYLPVQQLPNLEALRLRLGFGGHRLRILGIKLFADGSLGARTAALKEPYSDAPTRGCLRYGERELKALVERIDLLGIQVAIHAIGDEAISLVVRCLKGTSPSLRHRVEHATLMDDEAIAALRSLRCLASIQPFLACSDGGLAKRLGDRMEMANRFRSLLKAGVAIAMGSDYPVGPISPLAGIGCASRLGREALSVEEALRCYTRGSAYASHDEGRLGVIKEGALADLVILSEDLTEGKEGALARARVMATILDGRVVYKAAEVGE